MNYFLRKIEIIGPNTVGLHETCNSNAKLFLKGACLQEQCEKINFYYNSTRIWHCNYKPLFFFVAVLVDVK